MSGLFGADFEINVKNQKSIGTLLKKASNDQENKKDLDRVLKSKTISLTERLGIITERVLTVLGKQKNNIIVIKDKAVLHNYISDCINTGRIDIDTETNNSLDPVTCKLMGPCFYAPGLKQAYVPINHVDPNTMKRLSWQLTEQDIHDELQRVLDAKTMVIMHNGKFDYEVLKCTCNIEIPPDWDTIIAAKLIDENEFKEGRASLKYIYTTYIDKSQVKYDIENLFENVQYAVVDPNIFALYAATDAMMTDKVYEMQKPILDQPDNSKIKWIFENIEMPIVKVTAEMELTGVAIDLPFGQRLKTKYNQKLNKLDNKINAQLVVLNSLVKFWKTLPSANKQTRVYQPKKTKLSLTQIEEKYPYFDNETNKRYKIGKCRAEQIGDEISLTSPIQLAILFYDILHCPAVSKKSPRGTGEEELKALSEKLTRPIKLINEIITSLKEELLSFKQTAQVSYENFYEEDTSINTNTAEIKENTLFDFDELSEDFEDEKEDEDDNSFIEMKNIPVITINISANMSTSDINTLLEQAKELYTKSISAAQVLCQAILDRRGMVKLMTTYIDVIPDLAKHWPDHRIRFHLNSLGTDTGRYSSGGKIKFIDDDGNRVVVPGINIQNIPSHNKEIRMLFMGQIKEDTISAVNEQYYELPEISEIETADGWKFGKDLQIGDVLITEDTTEKITSINYNNKIYYIYTN